MGDIREFWSAVAIYVISAVAIYAAVGLHPWFTMHRLTRVVAVLGGGVLLAAIVIVMWAGIVKACEKLKK